jgi:catechol 2,3-dioxygenase-like lactoylglutathione lyase family enzyme
MRGRRPLAPSRADTRFVHVNLVARDWRALARFYVKALGCTPKLPERDLAGDWLDKATSLRAARIRGIHLRLPGYASGGPTLEIFRYAPQKRWRAAAINAPGYAHIAFSVASVAEALKRVKRCGGGTIGRPVSARIVGAGRVSFVYARDPEGNIIELQKWK